MTDPSYPPLVTVYIPCRNYGRFLAQALDSLIAQLHTNWEAIVVDEASEDDSLEVAARYTAMDARVHILRNDAPTGLQKVANRVLGLARGKYIVRLDADDWLDEGALLLMAAKLEANPEIGIVYGNYFYTDEAGAVIGTERRHRLGDEDTAGHLAPHGACTMVRTRALKAVGGYSEDINAQDGWELWYKLQNRVGAASLDVPIFYYRQHGTSLSRNFDRLLTARSRIFERIANSLQGGFTPTCLAVIPVRESYPGFEGVPYRNFAGQSMLQRAILSAANAKQVTKVIVSSQSKDVLNYAEKLEAQGLVPKHLRLHREKEFEQSGSVPMREIMHHAGTKFSELTGAPPDIVMFHSIHAVHRRSEHIDTALNVLRITESDSVVSVQEERDPLFSHGSVGLTMLNPGRLQDLSYDRERVYRFNGAIIGCWWDLLGGGELLGEKVSYIEMSPADSVQIKTDSMLDDFTLKTS